MNDLRARVKATLDMPPTGGLIVVAMSGGVDSSVTAALLADMGMNVVGITLQLYDHGAATARTNTCCAGRDILDAKRVAEHIGIPHYVLDYESRFRHEVMEEFADSYLRGETPIPCVRCNQTVKFRDLMQVARDLGASALATGHYVRRVPTKTGVQLHRGAEEQKDQSHFLFATTREQLDLLRFPLGELSKEETRHLADELGLAIAQKPDSQDICFVPNGNYRHIVERLRPGACDAGEIVTMDGEVLGSHAGIIGFTIGQRKGLGVAVGTPQYVIDIEPDTRRVIVGPQEALEKSTVFLKDINWLGDGNAIPAGGMAAHVRLRSTTPPQPAFLLPDGQGGAVLELETPDAGISPGQAGVLYDDTRVLGGGWIRGTA